MKTLQVYIGLFIALFWAVACQNEKNFKVDGVVSGADGQTLYLENVGISSVTILDSAKLNGGDVRVQAAQAGIPRVLPPALKEPINQFCH